MSSMIMALQVFLVATIFCLCLGNSGAQRLPLKDENNFILDEQVRAQPITSVVGKGGDIYDCFDRNNQPAMDHPLLKNHKIQVKPTSFPKGHYNRASSIIFGGIECPKGTIPTRRIYKKDLVRANEVKENDKFNGSLAAKSGTSRSMYTISLEDGSKYHGAQASMNVLNPRVFKDQSSFSLIWVESGDFDSGNFATIQAGWTVSQNLYGDSKTRFVILWQSISQGKVSGCVNERCPGFVHVDNKIPLDDVLNGISEYDGVPYEIQVSIFQDPKTKDWWVTIPDKNIRIGYWPSALIPQLSGGADSISWGGYTIASPDGLSPEMGYGNLPDGNSRHSSYLMQILAINDRNEKKEPYGTMEQVVDNPQCYGLKKVKSPNPDEGYAVLYGGPGGQCT